MINIAGAEGLHKIAILNPKGGSGKTTLATNLASCYALSGRVPTLIDLDPKGFCAGWLDKRPSRRPAIYGIDAHEAAAHENDSSELTVPSDSSVAIVDLPSAIPHDQLHVHTYLADSVLIPIMPSEIDVYSATRFIAELLLDVQLDRREKKLGIVVTRALAKTKSYRMLVRFLASLQIPVIATLRQSQNYVHAAALGAGICELPAYRIRNDIGQMNAILAWLNHRRLLSSEERQAMIAQLAYRYAQQRGFEGGNSVTDWLTAEKEVDTILAQRSGS